METGQSSLLYRTVADDISAMIRDGVLGSGERVPSLRRLSRQRRISITTVLQAYQLLESRGLIEARPQSGFYVRATRRALQEPAMSRPPKGPQSVEVHALVTRMLHDMRRSDLVALGTSMPDPGLLPAAKLRRILAAVARRRPSMLTEVSFPPGHEALRRQIALRMADWGVRADPDEIVVTGGCIEALNLCLRAAAQPGDVVALESPTYFGLLQIIESLGMKALQIPTHAREGISLDALALALERENVKACVLMPTVSVPLGSTMPERAKKRAVGMLAERDIPLIEYCVYSALHFGPEQPFAAKAYDKKGNVMLCSSFSKTFSPGFRLGWAMPGRYTQQVGSLKLVSSGGVSDLLQITAAQYLANGGYDRLLRTLRRSYARRIEAATRIIGRHFPAKTRITMPSGGFALWVVMPEGADSIAIYEQALKEGIGIAPGPLFSASGRYRNCIRINCGVAWSERAERAIARVGELACNALGQPRMQTGR